MFGPYGRMPYSRNYLGFTLHNITLEAAYKMAGALSTMFVVIVLLLGQYVCRGYRVRYRLGKLLSAAYQLQGSAIKRALKPLVAGYVMAAGHAGAGQFYRSARGTYGLAGAVYKRIFIQLLGTFKVRERRLKMESVLGFSYTGDLEPGDRIVINSGLLTVTVNGVNVLDLVEGQLPFFAPGLNQLTYTDGEGARSITARIYWRGGWA